MVFGENVVIISDEFPSVRPCRLKKRRMVHEGPEKSTCKDTKNCVRIIPMVILLKSMEFLYFYAVRTSLISLH